MGELQALLPREWDRLPKDRRCWMGSDTEELIKSPLVSVIVPAFNEQENIVPCTMAVRSALGRAGYDFEMLIVNDGSTDRTLEFVQAMQSKYQTVRVINFVQNYGKTVALRVV